LLQRIHLASAPSAIVGNDGHQQHVEKQISPDLMNDKKTTLSI
jgi:hypothetical protein